MENRDNYTFVRADICDSDAINKIFDENEIDRVVHFAAESHVDRSIKQPGGFCKDKRTWHPGHAECSKGSMGACGRQLQGRQEIPARIHR